MCQCYSATRKGRSIVSKRLELSTGHKKITPYTYPGREPFYKRPGFREMNTAMAIFENQEQTLEWGLVSND